MMQKAGIDVSNIATYPAPVRMVIFALILFLVWFPLAKVFHLLTGLPSWVLMYPEFIVLLYLWGKFLRQYPHPFATYGLELSGKNFLNCFTGTLLGFASLACLWGGQILLGWTKWQGFTENLPQLILEGFLLAFAVSFAEELLFRGWMLQELNLDYGENKSSVINSLIFAGSHYLSGERVRTLLAGFPGLFLLGLTLVWAKNTTNGRLGLSIGFHGGLVWAYYLSEAGNLIEYTGKVPQWVTGINDYPLAGVMGVLLLGLVGFGLRFRYIKTKD